MVAGRSRLSPEVGASYGIWLCLNEREELRFAALFVALATRNDPKAAGESRALIPTWEKSLQPPSIFAKVALNPLVTSNSK